jgi:hypothetical protein
MRDTNGQEGKLGQVDGQGEREFQHEGFCENCSAHAHLHEGLCRPCHRLALDERRTGVSVDHERRPIAPHQAPSIPLHSPPWRRRGA